MINEDDQAFLSGVGHNFVDEGDPDLLGRWSGHEAWWSGRLDRGLDPYSRSTKTRISTECEAACRSGTSYFGINFASQDYLSLASHPEICATAKATIDQFGVHSAGSAALMGNTIKSVELQQRLAAFLGYGFCTIFPTGWGAGYGAIRTLVRPADHVVIDILAHACLQEGAANATDNVHLFRHLSNSAVRRKLMDIRDKAPMAGILVVTESVFSMDSDVPNLSELQAICHEFSATLLVDVAHDLGAIGPTGMGYLELQGMQGKIDVVMGSFSKTFGSNGGFVASNAIGLDRALHLCAGPLTFTNAISPVSAAIISKALDIVKAEDGAMRRKRLMQNILQMRSALESKRFRVLGQPSAIVPVILGDSAISRLMTRFTLEAGGLVNLIEHPAVSRNTCRWRIQIMADHTGDQIKQFVELACIAREKATSLIKDINKNNIVNSVLDLEIESDQELVG